MFKKIALGLAMLGAAQFASAAHITIDDTDIDTYTVSWNYFEGGVTVNGTSFAGIATGSATFDDSVHLTFDGYWIDTGDVTAVSGTFELGSVFGAPGDITSSIGFVVTPDGPSYANVGLDFDAFTGSVYGAGPTSYFQGDVLSFGAPFLGITYHSEAADTAPVPAPASLALLGLGLLGLGLRRKV